MIVLLVEDQKAVRTVLTQLLQKWGHTVLTAADGKEAWEKLQTAPVDFLLADWNLPVMSGLELVEKVRQSPQFEFLPTLMISGRTGKTDVVEALATGTHNYLVKPFSPKQLKEKMEQVWSVRFGGSVAEHQVDRILKGHRQFDRRGDSPLIILGEATRSADELKAPDCREMLQYLARITYILSVVNTENPDLNLGYRLETSTREFLKQMRNSRFRNRVRLVLTSTEMKGSSTLLVRMLNINKISGLTALMVYNRIDELTPDQHAGLKKLGVELLERGKLTAEKLVELLDLHVVAPLSASAADGAFSPEGIRERITRDIQTMSVLPVLPQVCQRILELARSSESELKDWSAAIETDPLARATVVRRARSAQYGFQGDLKDLQHAVILLGKNVVKELIVSRGVKQAFEKVKESGFSLQDYWLHSVTVGLVAKLLSFSLEEATWTVEQRWEFEGWELGNELVSLLKRLRLYRLLAIDPVSQDPFIGGMMHDIGKVVMVHSYPGLYPMLVEELKEQEWKIPMLRAESTLAGGLNHAVAGEILGQDWSMGEEMCRVIGGHHAPEAGDSFSLLVGLADFLGGVVCPFPQDALYPPVQVVSQESLDGMEGFLPENFFGQVPIASEDLVALARLLQPVLRRHVGEMSQQET